MPLFLLHESLVLIKPSTEKPTKHSTAETRMEEQPKKKRVRKPWPMPPLEEEPHPRFLFIFTLPYSGSTALSHVLNTSPRSMLLHPTGEGQWIVKGLCQSDRWRVKKKVKWNSVKRVWLKRWRVTNERAGGIDVIIEKSPPNLCRMKGFFKNFPNSAAFGFNRDPYAFASSYSHRQHKVDTEQLSENRRRGFYRKVARLWVIRSRLLRAGIEEYGFTNFSYESFCENPAEVVKKIQAKCPELTGVDPEARIQVKNYEPQPISNQNDRQLAWLSQNDVLGINSVLRNHLDLMAYFGYRIREVDEFEETPAVRGESGSS